MMSLDSGAAGSLKPAPATAEHDLAWMERIKQGDMNAFQSLVEAHQHRVIGFVEKMLGSAADAEDVAQQVFLRIWKSAASYEPTAKFTTWLYTIARNLVLNELRRRKRHRTEPLERGHIGEERRECEYPDPAQASPGEELLQSEMQAAIQRAIDDLPEAQRLAIVLRRYDEFSYEEIGEIMGLSVSSVKSTLFRARITLREQLQQYLAE